MPGSPDKIFHDFLQLNDEDRRWVLEQIATRPNDEPVDMYVSAAAVFSADQFEEAEKKLRARGYIPIANPQSVE